MAPHTSAELFRKAQQANFHTLVIDAAPRKNGTHNDNTVLLAALNLESSQKEALAEYNHNQEMIEILWPLRNRTVRSGVG
eukprot:symbB.v1.2.028781.t1/scaffold3082.1/size64081/3